MVSLLTGEPEHLGPLGAEAPEGWIVTGYPWLQIETPQHLAFLDAFSGRWNEPPKLGAVVGYTMIKSIAAMLEKAARPTPTAYPGHGGARGSLPVRADHLARD